MTRKHPHDENDSKQHGEEPGERESSDSYLTISAANEAEIKILASRFLSYAVPAESAEEFLAVLEQLRREHYSATHHCFAWRIGSDGGDFRYSDDGEPSGTAGKRILGSIDREELTDTGIVVVRYFGGTKLGVGGLARAYSDAADAVLARCHVVRRYLTDELTLTFPYDMTSQVHHVIESCDASIDGMDYGEQCSYTIRVRQSRRDRFVRDLEEFTQRTVKIKV